MSTEHTSPSQARSGGLAGWRTRDILVLAILSLVFGIAMIFISTIYGVLSAIFSHALAGALLASLFVIPGLATPYILRRPGAAFLGQVLLAFVKLPFDPVGWTSLTIYIFLGILYELPFLVTRYRSYNLLTLICGGIFANLAVLIIVGLVAGGFNIAIGLIITSFVLVIVSGVVGPWLARLLADTIIKTGVLSRYAVSEQQKQV
jgi:energy-coupling factor transport system substrate-specific component